MSTGETSGISSGVSGDSGLSSDAKGISRISREVSSSVRSYSPVESGLHEENRRLYKLLKQFAEFILTINNGEKPSKLVIKNWIAHTNPEVTQQQCDFAFQTFQQLAKTVIELKDLMGKIEDLTNEFVNPENSIRGHKYYSRFHK